MSRKTATAALTALLDRAEQHGNAVVSVATIGAAPYEVRLDVADVRAILNKARFADRVNERRTP